MTNQNQLATQNYNSLKSLLASVTIKERFEEVLGTKSNQFVASILNAVYLNGSLRECDPNSIIVAAMNAAILDLPIDPNLGFSYIIPYKDHGNPKARFQIGYKGYLQLALRTGRYKTINATMIYEGEELVINRLTGEFVLTGKPASETVAGYAAYLCLRSGFEKTVYMSIEEMLVHAKRYSKSYNLPSSTWKSNPHEMGLKTVLVLLLRRWGEMTTVAQQVLDDDLLDIPTVTAATSVTGVPAFVEPTQEYLAEYAENWKEEGDPS